jgi:hypothetical protein
MIMKKFDYMSLFFCLSVLATGCLMSETDKAHDQDDPVASDDPFASTISDRWVSSTMKDSTNILRLAVHNGDGYTFITDGHRDHKPVWSKDGESIVFFERPGKQMPNFSIYIGLISVL